MGVSGGGDVGTAGGRRHWPSAQPPAPALWTLVTRWSSTAAMERIREWSFLWEASAENGEAACSGVIAYFAMSSSSWAKCDVSNSKTSRRVSKLGSLNARLNESVQIWCSSSIDSTPTEEGTRTVVGEPVEVLRFEESPSVFLCFLRSLCRLGETCGGIRSMEPAEGASPCLPFLISFAVSINKSANIDSTWRKASSPNCKKEAVFRLTNFPLASEIINPEHPNCP
mmetsp:Transcript_2810/g.6658  ORF Transcript_2810/g.6658 Transcript_2810/m.6658 type:complete len:226 (+) Transcript_2810:704-1381(+)